MHGVSADMKPRLAPPSLPIGPVIRIQTCYHISPGVRIGESVAAVEYTHVI
jgi:hypothetical protein